MRDDDKTDLAGWLGLRRDPDLAKARWLGSALSVVAVLLFVMAVAVVMAVLGHALFDFGIDAPRIGFGTGAVAVALIGAPFVIWRSLVAQETVNVTKQGHITDRINKAVEGLGAEKTVKRWSVLPRSSRDPMPLPGQRPETVAAEYTEPNLEVRIGAIYALERIAQDSDRDHVQIMEILCAYIRQNAAAPAEDAWPELDMKDSEDEGPLEADWGERLTAFRQAQNEAVKNLKPREDIQTALTVIGRRSAKQRRLEAGRGAEAPFPFDTPCPEYDGSDDDHDRAALAAYKKQLNAWKAPLRKYVGYRLDLREADLRGADLSGADLKGARLTGTYLQGADLQGARLQGADLVAVHLQGADLTGTQLQGAGLTAARLQGADLTAARSQGANLIDAWLQCALLWEARLQGAFFMAARLDEDTRLAGATLRGAAVRKVNFTDIPQIEAHLEGMFGDASVTLPGGHGPGDKDWPKHWPKFEMDLHNFDVEWRKWQANPTRYKPPDPPGPEDPA